MRWSYMETTLALTVHAAAAVPVLTAADDVNVVGGLSVLVIIPVEMLEAEDVKHDIPPMVPCAAAAQH